jgi:hypothetical protein
MRSQANPSASARSNGTNLETGDFSMLVNPETLIQLLREFVGRTWDGPATLSMTRTSPNGLTIDITPTGLCAKNSGTEVTTEANHQHSHPSQNYPWTLCRLSSRDTFELSPLIKHGKDTLQIDLKMMDSSLASWEERGIFSVAAMIQLPSEKQLRMTLSPH